MVFLIAAPTHDAGIPMLATIGLAGYGIHRYRANHPRQVPPPPPPMAPPLYVSPPVYLPPDAPRGERRTRQAIPQAVKVAVAARDQGRCQCTRDYCHGYPGLCGSTMDPHFDHIVPWSKSGADTVGNLQILCGPCNRRKGADDII